MELTKILNFNNIQAYKIKNPSKAFKKAYPKKIILALRYGESAMYSNTNTIPFSIMLYEPVGYIFTYDNVNLTKIFKDVSYNNIGSTLFTGKYNKYFEGDCNLIFNISACNNVVPCCMALDILIKSDIKTVMGLTPVQVKNSIKNSIKNSLSDVTLTVESWVQNIISSIPTNSNDLVCKFPDKITNKNVNDKNIKIKDLYIEYDLQASTRQEEFNAIKLIEESFEDFNKTITIYENYNEIVKKIKEKAKDKKIKFTENKNKSINIKYSDLCKLDMKYKISDFI